MLARLHPFVQDAHDLDRTGPDCPIEDHMRRFADRRLAALVAAMPDMQAAKFREEIASVDG